MKGYNYERELMKILEKHGYIVIRSAGSSGHGDLVALKPSGYHMGERIWTPIIIECKKTSQKVFYISGEKRVRQYNDLLKLARKDIKVYYAIRFKGDKTWYFFLVHSGKEDAEWKIKEE